MQVGYARSSTIDQEGSGLKDQMKALKAAGWEKYCFLPEQSFVGSAQAGAARGGS